MFVQQVIRRKKLFIDWFSRKRVPGSLFLVLSLVVSCRIDYDVTFRNCINEDDSFADVGRFGLTTARLSHLRNNESTHEWKELLARLNAALASGTLNYDVDAYHFAIAFVVTKDPKFAFAAKQIIFRIIDEPGYCDVTESYWRAPDCTRQVSLTAEILMDQLSNSEKNKVFDYLETNARNIVEVIGWSGWGWQEGNPGFRQLNNYYPGHLQTILNYALLAYEDRPLAREYFQLVVEEELPGAFELIRTKLANGHGAAGTWYDDKLYNRYAEAVLMVREASKSRIDYGSDYRDVFSEYLMFRLNTFGFDRQELSENLTVTSGHVPYHADGVRFWLMMDVLGNPDVNEFKSYSRYFDPTASLQVPTYSVDDQLNYLMLR